MMLPSALPMVLLFDRIGRERRRAERAATPTVVFVASHLAVWGATGLAAYLADRAIRLGDFSFLSWDRRGPLVAGAAIAAAGIYELTPLKRICLGHCRGPLHFLLGRWQPGWSGAVAMASSTRRTASAAAGL